MGLSVLSSNLGKKVIRLPPYSCTHRHPASRLMMLCPNRVNQNDEFKSDWPQSKTQNNKHCQDYDSCCRVCVCVCVLPIVYRGDLFVDVMLGNVPCPQVIRHCMATRHHSTSILTGQTLLSLMNCGWNRLCQPKAAKKTWLLHTRVVHKKLTWSHRMRCRNMDGGTNSNPRIVVEALENTKQDR